MTKEEKDKKKLTDKKYRDANKEKRKEYDKKRAETHKEKIKDYRELNRDKILEYNKEYLANNREELNAKKRAKNSNNYVKNKEYREKNKEHRKDVHTKYYKLNKDKLAEYQKEYCEKNKDKIRERGKLYLRNKKANDPLFKLKSAIRVSIAKSFTNKGYSKKSKTFEILGCSFEEFKIYLESQFESWMTWENRGKYMKGVFNYGWDIDHIEPLSNAITEEDIVRLNHYTNLRPLCSKYNRDIKRNILITS